jgi:tripartite ATP-independent transporter DctM subunit
MIALALLVLLLILALFLPSGGTSGLPVVEIGLLIIILLVFFGSGIYVAAALGGMAAIIGFTFSDRPFWLAIGQVAWGPSSSFILVSIPLFLLMGEILLRAGLSERLFRALNVWLVGLPGGLLHTNIVASGVFSAISGSSVATAATIGSVALPYFERTGYDRRMVLGSLAAGGALGNLVPPGITFILYGLITDTSVAQLYVAAVVPSILVMALFCALNLRHRAETTLATGLEKVPLGVMLRSLIDLIPTALLIVVVLGTIYGGLATPTEAAALGVVAAIALASWEGKLSWHLLHQSGATTARTTAMLGLILIAAFTLNFILTSIRVPQTIAATIAGLPLPGWAVIAIIIGVYLALGTFMEGFSMVITTLPVIFPIVKALGYDPVWFGVIVTMMVEIALITPPDGTVLYVLQGLRPSEGPLTDVFAGAIPYVIAYLGAVLTLMLFPELALWLPTALDLR